MTEPLWQPSDERIKNSNMSHFVRRIDQEFGLLFENYHQLHQWSVNQPEVFWEQVWKFTGIISSQPYLKVLDGGDDFPGARWFYGARLNFAENLLRYQNEDQVALVSRLENGRRTTLTYKQTYDRVARLAAALRTDGVVNGDRVAGFLPNVPEAVIAMLATTSIGAIWSSCSPDFGLQGVVDRFGQIQPKVLFVCDGYFYNGKAIDSISHVKDIPQSIPGIERLVLVPVTGNPVNTAVLEDAVLFDSYVDRGQSIPSLVFEQVPFDHPLFIMYSSGTTGMPKCIVHGVGSTLIQHLKEHQLHVDLHPGDRFFYYTTCGWMMWNWLVSGLASGATLVLYDGSPMYPDAKAMMDLAEEEQLVIFGTSAKFISALEKAGVKPRETHDLSALKTILSTGSPLSNQSFRYVYRDLKSDVCLSSISGGTDIISCFVLGNPCLPVWEGEIQCLGLGMAVEVWDENGKSLTGEKGELVCTRPFPSAPMGFWNDPDDEKYLTAYFNTYPNTWAHGDFAEITDHHGVIIHGRSDAVLNPGGVRIGTAEIYRQVETLNEIVDSVCIGQKWQGDVRVVLFVILREGVTLTNELQEKIRQTIRRQTTPRHVPAKIIAVSDIPRTISGKIVELAVRNVVHGKPVKNTDALANPKALELFEDLPELRN